jgi:hypothetical protein
LEGDFSPSFNKENNMEVRELNVKQKNTMPALERDKLVKQMRVEDDKLRTGMFEFLDAQGGWFEFAYRKYPGESVKMIKLIHGEICDMPMGIIKHLNNTKRKVRRYNLELPSSGGKVPRSYETVSRLRFTPTDVM